MERAKRPYSIQKRPTSKKNRSLYYVQFRSPETTKYMAAVSSGQTSKSNAQNLADEQIKSNKVIDSDKKNIFFEPFAKEFWEPQALRREHPRGEHWHSRGRDTWPPHQGCA